MSDHLPFGVDTLVIPFTIVRPPRSKPAEREAPPQSPPEPPRD